jgi:hypothetical protein
MLKVKPLVQAGDSAIEDPLLLACQHSLSQRKERFLKTARHLRNHDKQNGLMSKVGTFSRTAAAVRASMTGQE